MAQAMNGALRLAITALLGLGLVGAGCGGTGGHDVGGASGSDDAGSGAPDGSAEGAAGSTDGGKPVSGDSGAHGGDDGGSSSVPMTSSVRIIVEPSDDAAALVQAIRGAKQSVHMTMYLLTSTAVMDALIAQKKAGLDVKVLLNQNFPSASGTNASSYPTLQSAGVDVKWASPGFTYTHEKAVILDGKEAWIMTMNTTQSSPTANREYLAVDDDPADVAEAEGIFEYDFGGPSYSPSGRLVVSPNNSRSKLTALLDLAKTSIDMEAEELTDMGLVAALTGAADRGVAVRVVLADAQSTTQAATLKQHGVKLAAFSQYYVHAKAAVVDGQYAYVGSENFSAGSLGYNRELGVLFDTASEVHKVAQTTASDFAGGSPL
jgi:phosphatidylserine/phosphatidylglycerophosphate/cardiolipin synthase-like enzyme